ITRPPGRGAGSGAPPFPADQATPGPMARSVTDAAIMPGALEGAQADPNDPATTKCPPPAGRDYTRFLNPNGLKGARIGIPRAFFYDSTPAGATRPRGGLSPAQRKDMDGAVGVRQARGAGAGEPATSPTAVAT